MITQGCLVLRSMPMQGEEEKDMSNLPRHTLCEEGSIKHKMVVQQPLSGLHTERGRQESTRTSLANGEWTKFAETIKGRFSLSTLQIT